MSTLQRYQWTPFISRTFHQLRSIVFEFVTRVTALLLHAAASNRLKMKQIYFCLMLLLFIHSSYANVAVEEANEPAASNATGRFLSLFSVVRFSNSFCYGANGFNGTCYTSAECTRLGGTASGTCASGFGVCCTICITQCGQTATVNNTYWANPGYSSSYSTAGQCSLTVKKCASNICQVRLDFLKFVIANPDQTAGTATSGTASQCLYDTFTVSGQSNNVPGICGTNTNQHMYLDMTPGTSQFTLNMLLTGTNTSRTWKIRIAQIPCGTTYTAPDSCLQYYTSSIGTFSSFNYQYSTTPPVQYIASQDYTICIRMNQGFCGICYQLCDEPSTVPAANKFNMYSTPQLTMSGVDADCTTDWIQIPCATDQQSSSQLLSGGTACVNKLCGSHFNTVTGQTTNIPIYSYRKPFEVRVFTDAFNPTAASSIGFCLKYQQLACTSG